MTDTYGRRALRERQQKLQPVKRLINRPNNLGYETLVLAQTIIDTDSYVDYVANELMNQPMQLRHALSIIDVAPQFVEITQQLAFNNKASDIVMVKYVDLAHELVKIRPNLALVHKNIAFIIDAVCRPAEPPVAGKVAFAATQHDDGDNRDEQKKNAAESSFLLQVGLFLAKYGTILGLVISVMFLFRKLPGGIKLLAYSALLPVFNVGWSATHYIVPTMNRVLQPLLRVSLINTIDNVGLPVSDSMIDRMVDHPIITVIAVGVVYSTLRSILVGLVGSVKDLVVQKVKQKAGIKSPEERVFEKALQTTLPVEIDRALDLRLAALFKEQEELQQQRIQATIERQVVTVLKAKMHILEGNVDALQEKLTKITDDTMDEFQKNILNERMTELSKFKDNIKNVVEVSMKEIFNDSIDIVDSALVKMELDVKLTRAEVMSQQQFMMDTARGGLASMLVDFTSILSNKRNAIRTLPELKETLESLEM